MLRCHPGTSERLERNQYLRYDSSSARRQFGMWVLGTQHAALFFFVLVFFTFGLRSEKSEMVTVAVVVGMEVWGVWLGISRSSRRAPERCRVETGSL